MARDPLKTALVKYLEMKSSVYYGKIQELSEVLRGWLSYIPQTFPHYTRHTIEHSEEIILQLSKLLFKDEDPEQPTVPLTSVEAYILITAAYLHDAGMVTSDTEKAKIVASDSWKNWTSGQEGGAIRWNKIEAFRQGKEPPEKAQRDFLADVQTRYLIAEFIRGRHHFRSANVISQHQSTLGRFAFDNKQLEEAIANVCVGHGLNNNELLDPHKYPERRDIRGESVNLRFLAILLRLGDLLDMGIDRACPLLSNPASPVPPDSLAHWTQYQVITHHMTAPDRIEISASCNNQNEHRVLQDWCKWIVDEVNNARVVMSSAARYSNWRPPHVSMCKPDQTINITPSETAKYIPSNWTLQIDRDMIMERLIYNVHNSPKEFVLELIQNALDATRSRMYHDLIVQGTEPPDYPTQVHEDIRSRYPIHIRLEEVEVKNELSGEYEKKQILSIDDLGTGMNLDIIERYFLQIGRSYYSSEEYRTACKFNPISKFGIGFLTVFAVSDEVVVETFKPEQSPDSKPIQITLTGPSNYLLSETGTREVNGTQISVRLRESFDPHELTGLVNQWCRRVEFPIVVDDLGSVVTVEAEKPNSMIYRLPDVTEEGAEFVIRSFEISRPPIEGHLYVFAHLGKDGERWDLSDWASEDYEAAHPQAVKPTFLKDSYTYHGIARGNRRMAITGALANRIDYRGNMIRENMSRQKTFDDHLSLPFDPESNQEIITRWEDILTEHLLGAPITKTEKAWEYKQRLVTRFPFKSYWRKQPGTTPLHHKLEKSLVDLHSILELNTLRVLKPRLRRDRFTFQEEEQEIPNSVLESTEIPTLINSDLDLVSKDHLECIFRNRRVNKVDISLSVLEIYWEIQNSVDPTYTKGRLFEPFDVVELPDDTIIGLRLHPAEDSPHFHCVMNSSHPFVQWMTQLMKVDDGESNKRLKVLMSLLRDPMRYRGYHVELLENYLRKWRALPGLQSDSYPPKTPISMEMFR